jgi:hypothetical protein
MALSIMATSITLSLINLLAPEFGI